MKNIHVIPTDKPSRLLLSKRNNLQFLKDNASLNSNNHFEGTYQNIYITSNEEIKEDWFITNNNEIFKCIKNKEEQCFYSLNASILTKFCNKIILTTDQDLIKNGIQAIDNEFLEWFVKNSSCEEVDVKNPFIANVSDFGYKIIIPKEAPNQVCENCKIEISKYGCACGKQEKPKQETLGIAAENNWDNCWGMALPWLLFLLLIE